MEGRRVTPLLGHVSAQPPPNRTDNSSLYPAFEHSNLNSIGKVSMMMSQVTREAQQFGLLHQAGLGYISRTFRDLFREAETIRVVDK
jgi:hypothetical protein